MIITLITIGIIIGAAVCLYISDKFCSFLPFVTGVFLMVSALFVTALVGIGIISAQVNGDINYQNNLHEREMLEYRIEHIEENITGNEMLYNDIAEFNNELRSTKKWANSPWTNWFYNQDIATIDYIEINMV